MIQLLILADDLTGANDTGVQLAKKGVPTLVTIDSNIDIGSIDPQIAVLVIDTESRHLPPIQASRQVRKTVRRARQAGISYFYKKTDSTLRGNVGAELTALMEVAGSGRLMFIPAYPKESRYTRRGYQYVGNDLVHTTAFGHDPFEPISVSFIPGILGKQTSVKTTVLSPRANGIAQTLNRDQGGIYIFDCETDEHLIGIGKILAANQALHVLAGSAGFAELLPDLLHMPRVNLKAKKNSGPLLVVNGSLNEVSLQQVAIAGQHGFTDIVLPPKVLFAKGQLLHKAGEVIANQIASEAESGNNVVVRTIKHREELTDYMAQSGLSWGDISEMYLLAARNMGRIIAGILKTASFGYCAVFGGDTVYGVIRAMACSGFLPREEIINGLALAEVVGASRDINFITKAGGFGDQEVILKIVNYIGNKE